MIIEGISKFNKSSLIWHNFDYIILRQLKNFMTGA